MKEYENGKASRQVFRSNILAFRDITSAFIQITNKVPQVCPCPVKEQAIDKSNEKEYNHFQLYVIKN
jgi:hypothetical protein